MIEHLKLELRSFEKYDSTLVDRAISPKINPFIFSFKLDSWRAFSLWTPSFFKEKYGDQVFDVNPHLPKKTAPYLYSMNYQTTFMKLADFIDLMFTNNSCYLAEASIDTFKGLETHHNFFDLIPASENERKTWINIWIGANTRSGLHFDMIDNFLVQIYGIKKFILISPEDIKLTYPISSHFSKSPVNPFEPDLKKFPKFSKARLLHGELKPGDTLFIPKGWYHYLYAPQQSISLNCFYGRPFTFKQLLSILYRSGWKSWVTAGKDFFWYGLLARPFENKLYCTNPFGKDMYDRMIFYVKNRSSKYLLKFKCLIKENHE